MVDRKSAIEEQRHVTENITGLCRYIGFGVAAACYALFTSNSTFASNFIAQYKSILLIAALFAILTILFDYLQFLCGYIMVRKALNLPAEDCGYDTRSLSYRCRFRFFYLKQISVVLSVVALIISLLAIY